MHKSELDVAKILIFDERKSRTTVSVFLSSPTPLEEVNLGRLFILSEIEATDRESENIINLVEEEIVASYYGSSDFNIEVAFENALAKTNARLHQLIAEGHTDWLEKFSTVVAVIKGGNVHFTNLGRAHAFLIHSKQIVDLLENSQAKGGKINPLKIFSNIVSGALRESDALLFCTASLLDYLSLEKLRKTINEHPPQEAAQYLQALLMENTINATFGSIIVKVMRKKEVMAEGPPVGFDEGFEAEPAVKTPDESMSTLISQEQNTNSLLEPSIWVQMAKSVSTVRNTILSLIGRKPRAESTQAAQKDRQTTTPLHETVSPSAARGRGAKIAGKAGSIALTAGKAGALGLGRFISWLLDFFRKTSSGRKSPRTYVHSARRMPKRTSQGAASILLRLMQLPRKRKIILLAAVVLIIIFSWSIVNQGEQQETQVLRDQYAENVTRAEQKVSEADAALIYENEEDARVFLVEAKELLNSIPDNEKEFQDDKTRVLGDVDSRLVDVNHVIKVQPKLVANVAGAFPEAALAGLARLGDHLYSVDANNNILYQIDAEGTVLDVERSLTIEGNIDHLLDAGSSLLLLSSTKSLTEFSEPTDFTAREIIFSLQDSLISGGTVFNDNMYLLDSQNNQLLKHTKTGANFSEGLQWIKDKSLDVSGGISVSIDGSVYIGTSDGQIIKLFQGNKDAEFKLSTPEPRLGAVKDLVADDTVENIYVLDRENNRVVVFTKTGKFVKQYRSDTFDRLEAMIVDEPGGTITVVNNTSIYEFPI